MKAKDRIYNSYTFMHGINRHAGSKIKKLQIMYVLSKCLHCLVTNKTFAQVLIESGVMVFFCLRRTVDFRKIIDYKALTCCFVIFFQLMIDENIRELVFDSI